MHLYIISARSDSGPLHKIGITNNHGRRLATLATGCPFPLVLVGTIEHDSPRTLERRMHAALRQYRLNGEWFSCPIELIIEAATTCGGSFVKADDRPLQRADFDDSFAGKLKFYSAKLRMTQFEIAELLEVSHSAVFIWMKNKRPPHALTQEGAIDRLQKRLESMEAA